MSDHWDGRVFRNLHDPTVKTLREVWRWRRAATPEPWPRRVDDPPQPPPVRVGAGRIAATFIGHATFLLQIGGRCVLFDPIWSARASPCASPGRAGCGRRDRPWRRCRACDLLLVTHCHYDHLDLPTLRAVRRRWKPAAATGLGNARHLAKAGIRGARELDWWEEARFGRLRVTYVPAQHFSARTPWDRNRSLWGGFVVEAEDGGRVYFAGDSGLVPAFRRDRHAASQRSTSRCCRSAPTSRAGSCAPSTWTRRRPCGRIWRSARGAASGCISAPSPG